MTKTVEVEINFEAGNCSRNCHFYEYDISHRCGLYKQKLYQIERDVCRCDPCKENN